jgi:glyoxylase-like metal-dependent hydrolase (beta-lactamase superfamily II)
MRPPPCLSLKARLGFALGTPDGDDSRHALALFTRRVSVPERAQRCGRRREGLSVQLAPGVHSIGPTTHGLAKGGYSRAYLFEDGDELTLVDTLWDDDAHVILDYLWSIGRSPTQLKHIVLTHAHRSHLGGVAVLKQLSGAEVSCHESEAPIVEGIQSAAGVSLRPLRPVTLLPFRVLSRLGFPKHVPCQVDRRDLTDGDAVGPLTVLHTPGHTPGHLALYWKESVLIVGDAIATWPSFGAGWPGFNLDEPAYRESLRRLLRLKPEVVGPGHGSPISGDTSRRLSQLVTQLA